MSDTSQGFGSDTTLQQLEGVLLNKRVPRPAVSGIRTGTVVSATSSTVTVTIKGFDSQATFVCRYEPRWNPAGTAQLIPTAGTACALAFSGNDLNDGWALAFAGWPGS